MSTLANSLSGCGIAITRPADQAQELAHLVRQAGGEPVLFPLLAIAALDDYVAFDAVANRIEDFDWAIFISSNAVQHGLMRLLAHRTFPAALRCAAIGPSTAAELARFGISEAITPSDRFDSESLLNLPEMQAVAGKRFIIFRGQGGRELIAETLRQRGAEVEFAEAYRRINPQQDAGELVRLWQNNHLHAIVVTSSEALRNLLALTKNHAEWLKQTPLFVNHARIAEAARSHGLQAITAQAPGDAGIMEALIDWRKKKSPI